MALSRKSVQGAYCPKNGYGADACVLQKSECPTNDSFYSSREMQGSPNVAHGGICLHSQTVFELPLGSCVDGTCSPNEASCGVLGLHSVKDVETCLVQNTAFGRCGDRCSWSPDDCGDNKWIFPSQGCSCDQVEVGACEKDGLIFCAVSSDSCDDKSTWLSRDKVKSTTANQCFLCREKTKPFEPKPIEPDANETLNNEDLNIEDLNNEDGANFTPGRASTGTSALVGGLTGGLVGAAMVVILFLFIRKRQAEKAGKTKIPMKAVDVETDNVSVL